MRSRPSCFTFCCYGANNQMSCASDICNEFVWQLVKSGLADLFSNRTMFRSSEVNMGTSHAWSQVKIDIPHIALCCYNLQSYFIAISVLPIKGVERKYKQFCFQHCIARCCPRCAGCKQESAEIVPETLPEDFDPRWYSGPAPALTRCRQ